MEHFSRISAPIYKFKSVFDCFETFLIISLSECRPQ